MCVICVCVKRRPSIPDLEACAKTNTSGMGIAWIDNHKVLFRKGIQLLDIKKLNEQLPFPYVIHFRQVSIGKVLPGLCHPFPISNTAMCDLEGRTDSVLFHNGTWSLWEDYAMRHAIAANKPIPEGPWSDTRAIAWIVKTCGINFLQFLTGKFCVLDNIGPRIFGSDWTEDDGIFYSNTIWKPYESRSVGFNQSKFPSEQGGGSCADLEFSGMV